MNSLQNIEVIKTRPENARSRMELRNHDGSITIVYDKSVQQLLRIAMGLKAININIMTMH